MDLQERTTPYLKPLEVETKASELRRLQEVISAPQHIRSQVQDMGMIVRRRNDLRRDLEKNAPQPYTGQELDRAVARESTLLTDIVQGMPTQAEMRRAPPGAVDKHMAWEKANKTKILEWKNIRRRLHASGDNPSPDVVDLSNLEKHRPQHASHEVNMDNAVIPGKSIHIPPDIAIRNTMTDAERFAAKLETYRAMAEQGDERAKAILKAFEDDDPKLPEPAEDSHPVKKPPTQKQAAARKAAGDRLRKMHEERRRKK